MQSNVFLIGVGINCFDDVKAVLFVVNLAGYNSVLFEDEKRNRMQEAMDLFEQVTAEPSFKSTPIFLFFNKKVYLIVII
jgi:thioredoxin-related protein